MDSHEISVNHLNIPIVSGNRRCYLTLSASLFQDSKVLSVSLIQGHQSDNSRPLLPNEVDPTPFGGDILILDPPQTGFSLKTPDFSNPERFFLAFFPRSLRSRTLLTPSPLDGGGGAGL